MVSYQTSSARVDGVGQWARRATCVHTIAISHTGLNRSLSSSQSHWVSVNFPV